VKQTLLRQQWFYLPYLAVMMICGYMVIHLSKAELHIMLNQYNSPGFDQFFKYITIAGDGSFLPVFILIMLMVHFRGTILMIATFLLSGLFVQVLKRFVFDDIARPVKYFQGSYQLHLVENIDQHCCRSFPSGHSATAFGIFFCLALVSRQNWIKLLMLILAFMVAYSRVYLSQHFLIDIMAGSFIGLISAIICYPWIYSINKTWLDQNLITIIRTKK
jgi:membrane-associated phospholipid phosphatase